MTCIEPLTFTTLDGAERKFRLTARHEAAIAMKYGGELLTMNLAVALPKMLYMCLVDPDIEEDAFAEIMPPDPDLMLGFYRALKEHFSGPPAIRDANEKYRPTKGATLPLNGSNSLHSGEPTSVISENSGN